MPNYSNQLLTINRKYKQTNNRQINVQQNRRNFQEMQGKLTFKGVNQPNNLDKGPVQVRQ